MQRGVLSSFSLCFQEFRGFLPTARMRCLSVPSSRWSALFLGPLLDELQQAGLSDQQGHNQLIFSGEGNDCNLLLCYFGEQ